MQARGMPEAVRRGHAHERMIKGGGANLMLCDAVVDLADTGDLVALRLSSGAQIRVWQAVVVVAVNAGDEMRFNPPLRNMQEQLVCQKHQGRTFKILMQAKGVKPGAPAAGEGGGLRLMFSKRALPVRVPDEELRKCSRRPCQMDCGQSVSFSPLACLLSCKPFSQSPSGWHFHQRPPY